MIADRSGFKECPLFTKRIKAYIDSDTLILFDEKEGYVFGLEKESAALFLHLDELLCTYSEDEITKLFPDISDRYLKSLFDIREGRAGKNESYEPPVKIGPFEPDMKDRIHYDTGEITFSIAYPDSSFFDAIDPIFAHMRTLSPKGKRVNVDFVLTEGEWRILFNETYIAAAADMESLPLVLQENMIILHYQSRPYLVAIHAGAIGAGSKAIVFPGVSGSGKSTLTAAMAAKGYYLYSDEIALVGNDAKISSLPFCINIKEGSWSLLKDRFPILSDLRSYRRFDSQRVKLLPPLNLAENRADIYAVVFLEFDESCTESSLVPLSSCETLSRIKEAGYQLSEPLNKESLEKILSGLLEPGGFLLRYGSLEDALKEIESMLNG